MRYLRHPKAPRSDDEPLWVARTGLALPGNEIFHTVGRRAREAGLPVPAHQLRHTWASSMLPARHSEGNVIAARRLDRPLDALALRGLGRRGAGACRVSEPHRPASAGAAAARGVTDTVIVALRLVTHRVGSAAWRIRRRRTRNHLAARVHPYVVAVAGNLV